jgi:F0F1-type ATP synthase assembly protein I
MTGPGSNSDPNSRANPSGTSDGSSAQPGPEQDRKEKERRRGIAAYQGALEAVLAIVIAAGVGFWADQRFGTAPRWLIVGTCVGFGSFVLRLFRMRKLFEDASQADRTNRR